MSALIQQSTTAQVLEFLMVSSTDHVTPVTGLSPTVTLSKNGASFASPSGAVTEIGNGWYKVAGNATDNNTLGPLILHATGTAADPSDREFTVVAFNPLSATNLGLSALPTASPNANGGLPILSSSGTTLAYTVSTLTTYTGNTPQTGDSFARIGSTGSGLTFLAPSATALSTAVWTAPPAGFLAATFPGTVASTTNISAGTITTVTNLTNAPTSGDFTATMKTSIGTEVVNGTASLNEGITELLTRGDAYMLLDSFKNTTDGMQRIMWVLNDDGNHIPTSAEAAAAVRDVNNLTPAANSLGEAVNNAGGGGSGLDQQDVRDAMLLAPSGGPPAAGSIDAKLDLEVPELELSSLKSQ